MTASILKDYPDRAFPHVLIYSTLLAVLSIAVVGIVSFNVAFSAGSYRVASSWPVRLLPGPAIFV
jgi:hypothetical protein